MRALWHARGHACARCFDLRFLHAQLAIAADGYDTSGAAWHVRDPSVPDGDYSFEPGGPGVDVKDLALFLGLRSAQWVSPTGREVIDCDRIRASERPSSPRRSPASLSPKGLHRGAMPYCP